MREDATEPPINALLPGRNGTLVRLQCRPGMRPALLDTTNRYADTLEDEPGTEMFVVCVDPDDADVVWLYEIFRDEQAQLAHRSTAGFAKFMEEMPGLLAQPPGLLRIDPIRMALQQGVLENDFTV